MKQFFRLTVASLFFALTLGSNAAFAHADHGKPQFGGVVAEAGVAQFEIVAKDGRIVVHASAHGAPVAMAGATGKLTVLAGGAKSEIDLKPAGDNRLAGEGKLPAAAKLLLIVQMPGGKTAQARAVAP